jgi:hypothetical protein
LTRWSSQDSRPKRSNLLNSLATLPRSGRPNSRSPINHSMTGGLQMLNCLHPAVVKFLIWSKQTFVFFPIPLGDQSRSGDFHGQVFALCQIPRVSLLTFAMTHKGGSRSIEWTGRVYRNSPIAREKSFRSYLDLEGIKGFPNSLSFGPGPLIFDHEMYLVRSRSDHWAGFIPLLFLYILMTCSKTSFQRSPRCLWNRMF